MAATRRTRAPSSMRSGHTNGYYFFPFSCRGPFCFVQVSLQLSRGMDVILYTSRGVPLQGDGAGGLVFGERVGGALVACVAGLTGRPRFLVSKGGITSSDVATQALGMKRAEVSECLLYGGGWRTSGSRNRVCCGGDCTSSSVRAVRCRRWSRVPLWLGRRGSTVAVAPRHDMAFDRNHVGTCSHATSLCVILPCLGRMQNRPATLALPIS